MRELLAALLCTLAAAAALPVSAAQADVFEPVQLASDGFLPGALPSATQQAGYADNPVIAGDGRYVAFDGYFAGLIGVWRRDLQTGEVQPVAVGSQLEGLPAGCATTVAGAEKVDCDAELPSISETGQYISFTTSAPLAAHGDKNQDPDVYVRNMAIEASETEASSCGEAEEQNDKELRASCAFALVSAVNGSDEGLSYVASRLFGAVAAPRTAISANGEKVAFVTTSVSDLAGPNTPAMQVAVRNLATDETELVSTRFDATTGRDVPNEPVSGAEGERTYGAAYANAGSPPPFPIHYGGHAAIPSLGASISADGSTVAWLGANVGQQAHVLAHEEMVAGYAEPLWRRIEEGPETPTRRVTGGSDPEAPACMASGEVAMPGVPSALDPCQGPFAVLPSQTPPCGVWSRGEGGAEGDFLPQLSADGYTVAFLASQPLIALGGDFGAEICGDHHTDLYVADMHPGLTRTQALRPLTELASGEEVVRETNAPIVDLALSPDGTQVAFTTERTVFPLSSPAYVSHPDAISGLAELFEVDLGDSTLTRVTRGLEGGPGEHPHKETDSSQDPYGGLSDGALSPSFSDEGDMLAFSSTASNLIYDDGNTPLLEEGEPFDGSDAFVVRRQRFNSVPAPQSLSPAPANPATTPAWTLGATAESLPDGSVRLYVQTPGAGSLHATAQGVVVARSPLPASSSRRTHATHKASKSSAARGRTAVRLASVTVASADALAKAEEGELVSLTLTLSGAYRALATAKDGFPVTVAIAFSAAGHPTLHSLLQVSFLANAKTARRAGKARTSGHRSRGRSRAGEKRTHR